MPDYTVGIRWFEKGRWHKDVIPITAKNEKEVRAKVNRALADYNGKATTTQVRLAPTQEKS